MLADMMSSLFGGPAAGGSTPAVQAPKGAKWTPFRQPPQPAVLEEGEDEEEEQAAQQPASGGSAAAAAPAPPMEEDLD